MDAKANKKKSKKGKHPRYPKGRLIQGMSKKLPVEIFDHPAFEDGLKKIMRRSSGIYALYKNEDLYRVGLTKDLMWRMKGYRKGSHAGKWNKFVIFRIRREDLLKDIETLILNLTNPPGNKTSGRVPKDADINRVLKKMAREYENLTRIINRLLK